MAAAARVYLAEWYTRHFAWRGVGADFGEAIAMLEAAWRVHCAADGNADPALFNVDDVNVTRLDVGTGMRDHMVLVRAGAGDAGEGR